MTWLPCFIGSGSWLQNIQLVYWTQIVNQDQNYLPGGEKERAAVEEDNIERDTLTLQKVALEEDFAESDTIEKVALEEDFTENDATAES